MAMKGQNKQQTYTINTVLLPDNVCITVIEIFKSVLDVEEKFP